MKLRVARKVLGFGGGDWNWAHRGYVPRRSTWRRAALRWHRWFMHTPHTGWGDLARRMRDALKAMDKYGGGHARR